MLGDPKLIRKEHVQSTNLSYLEAVYEALADVGENRDEVMRLVSLPLNDNVWMPRAAMIRDSCVKVDIAAEHGLVWVKVIARNAKAFRHELMGLEWEDSESESSSDEEEESDNKDKGASDFDDLPIFKKAREYLRAAQAHHVQFHTPIVVFAFMRIQPEEDIFVQRIMDRLVEMGIVVHLQRPDHSLQFSYMPLLKKMVKLQDISHLTTESLNMDVSSILAILSELSHHVCLPEDVSAIPLQVQAEREALVPALPQILPYITGKKLFIIQTAYDRLKGIVDVVGGTRERARFNYLFREHLGLLDLQFDQELWTVLPSLTIQVIEDGHSEPFTKLLDPPSRKSKLNNGRKIRTKFSDFHAKIFGSGDFYKMTTMTSIQWMETALKDAGLQGALIVSHEPRSLAERKMIAHHANI